MRHGNIMRLGGFAAMSAVMSGVCDAQRLTGPHPTGNVPAPVALDTRGLFQDKFARVGDDVFIGGQPTQRALRERRAQGVTTVINLRSPPEMARVPFDEAALVKELGMEYVYLPMRGGMLTMIETENARDFPLTILLSPDVNELRFRLSEAVNSRLDRAVILYRINSQASRHKNSGATIISRALAEGIPCRISRFESSQIVVELEVVGEE